MKRNNLKDAAFKNEIQISSLMETNADLAIMRKPYNKIFMKTYENAFNDYIKGNWESALLGFNKILELKPGDVPTLRHINHMKDNNDTPPTNWQGTKFFDE